MFVNDANDRNVDTACYGKLIQSWRYVAHYTMCGRVYEFAIFIH
jgi:hypothetical protein